MTEETKDAVPVEKLVKVYLKMNTKLSEIKAASKILHYCFFTPELQAAKVATFSESRQTKFSRRLKSPPCT
jgi:hypothetical protein